MDVIISHIEQRSDQFFDEPARAVRCAGRMDIDYWSIITTYELETKSGRRYEIYCKQPKSDWDIRTIDGLKRDSQSREMADQEYTSLRLLLKEFRDAPPTLRVVRPLDLVAGENAVLTEGVSRSEEVFQCLRRWDKNRHGRMQAEELLVECGRWVSYLHSQVPQGPDLVQSPDQNTVLDECARFAAQNADRLPVKQLERQVQRARQLDVRDDDRNTWVVPGIEVRNFIHAPEAIYFLDPGRVVVGSRYEDLARFVMSLMLLYWGTARFPLGYRSAKRFLEAFLAGYEDRQRVVDREELQRHLVLQYLQFWAMGLRVLAFKNYPKVVARLIHRNYMERSFSRELEKCFTILGV